MRFYSLISAILIISSISACKNDTSNRTLPTDRDFNAEVVVAKTKMTTLTDSIEIVEVAASELMTKIEAVPEKQKAAIATTYNFDTLKEDLMRLQKNCMNLESQQKDLEAQMANFTSGEGELSDDEKSDDSLPEVLDSYMFVYNKNKQKLEEMSTSIEELNIVFEELKNRH